MVLWGYWLYPLILSWWFCYESQSVPTDLYIEFARLKVTATGQAKMNGRCVVICGHILDASFISEFTRRDLDLVDTHVETSITAGAAMARRIQGQALRPHFEIRCRRRSSQAGSLGNFALDGFIVDSAF
jgi:hypothetical protein